MTDRELLELIAAKVGSMENEFIQFKKQTNSKLDELKNEVKKTNLTIENDIKPSMKVLFDGYTQNSAKLDRIEKEVSRQEEIILRKIK
ncbi:MAG: hypothetical protein MJA31_03455 [Clostridia bacterium]|nr:hypothetical protein [Clostridia bacterium]